MKKVVFVAFICSFLFVNAFAEIRFVNSGRNVDSKYVLVGVDANNNFVRDDVEKALASIFKKESDFNMSMKGARELQKIFLDSGLSYEVVENKFVCSTLSLGEKNQALIRNLVFNTVERQAIIKKHNVSQSASVEIKIDNYGNAVNPCGH